MFLTQNHKFLELSKSKSSKIQQFDYEYVSAVRCTSERGQMTKLEKIATSRNCNFMGVGGFLYLCKNNLQKKLTKASMYPSISKCNAKSCNCCQHLCTNTTITSSVNGRTFSVINNSDLD